MNKKLFVLVAAVLMIAALLFTAVAEEFAFGAVKRSEYEGNGVVEVDFARNVRYGDVQLNVTDASGAAVTAQLLMKDEDDLKFRIENFVPGENYAFSVSGVSAAKGGEALEVTGSIRIPLENEVSIRKVEYDRDGEIDIEFNRRVDYREAKVTVSSVLGGSFEVTVTELDRDGIEGFVKGLEYGGIYTIQVSGVSAAGAESYADISAEFVAVD